MEIVHCALLEINQKLGSAPSDLTPGKLHRFGEKDNCWAILRTWVFKQKDYAVCHYGSWRNSESYKWESFDKEMAKNAKFMSSFKKQKTELEREANLERQIKNKSCREKWLPIFQNAHTQDTPHEYLAKKSINSNFCAKINTKHNSLYIPMYDHEKFLGVQIITRDTETQQWIKRFSSGVAKKGAICPLSPFRDKQIAFLSEGFATAASIQMAFPNIPSICAFDAGNLSEAIYTIRAVNPGMKIVIASDRDENGIGEKKAKLCQKLHSEVIYKIPNFGDMDLASCTDFNDLHKFQGIDLVQKQLAIKDDDFFEIHFLGVSENKQHYYIASSRNKQISKVTPQSLATKPVLFKIAPESYYYKKYGAKTEGEDTTKIRWDSVIEDFTKKSLEKGFFDLKHIRGLGVWRDENHYIFNNGHHIYPNISKIGLLGYYNEVKARDISFQVKDAMSLAEMNRVYEGIKRLSLANNESHAYLASWMIQANIFHVFRKRFHLWMTGETSTGKSWIQEEYLEKVVYNCNRSKNSSVASIYGMVGDNITPIVFDESEPTKQGIDTLIQMARDATDSDGATKERMGQNGEVVKYKAICLFAFGSIQIPTMQKQDKNRFFFVESIPREDSGQDDEDFLFVEDTAQWLQENKSRFFARCYQRIPAILENEKKAFKYLRDRKLYKVSRTYELTAVMMACLCEYVAEEITDEIMDTMVEKLNLAQNEYLDDASEDSAEKCLESILTTIVDNHEHRTVSNCISIIEQNSGSNYDPKTCPFSRILASFGMRYFPQKREIFIHVNCPALKKKIPDFSDYAKVLRRNHKICVNPREVQSIPNYSEKVVMGIRASIRE